MIFLGVLAYMAIGVFAAALAIRYGGKRGEESALGIVYAWPFLILIMIPLMLASWLADVGRGE